MQYLSHRRPTQAYGKLDDQLPILTDVAQQDGSLTTSPLTDPNGQPQASSWSWLPQFHPTNGHDMPADGDHRGLYLKCQSCSIGSRPHRGQAMDGSGFDYHSWPIHPIAQALQEAERVWSGAE